MSLYVCGNDCMNLSPTLVSAIHDFASFTFISILPERGDNYDISIVPYNGNLWDSGTRCRKIAGMPCREMLDAARLEYEGSDMLLHELFINPCDLTVLGVNEIGNGYISMTGTVVPTKLVSQGVAIFVPELDFM